MTFGDKMTQEEIDDVFAEFDFDEDTGFIQTKSVVRLGLHNVYAVLKINTTYILRLKFLISHQDNLRSAFSL